MNQIEYVYLSSPLNERSSALLYYKTQWLSNPPLPWKMNFLDGVLPLELVDAVPEPDSGAL